LLIVVDSHSGVPVYRQIIEQVRFQVTAGLAEPGAELPSTRALSQALGVNPMTVSKAYGLLEEEGLVARRPGLPLVVADRPVAVAAAAKTAQLATLLEPVAVAARQLGVDEQTALELFRQVLSGAARSEESRA
jgi:GntR family transcriptional regulator